MRVYVLEQINPGWDQSEAKLVVAKTEKRARKLANASYGDEGPIWDDETKIFCSIVDLEYEYVFYSAYKGS
jgi:hypothetical protein